MHEKISILLFAKIKSFFILFWIEPHIKWTYCLTWAELEFQKMRD
jgi:hypothetical protein